MPVLPTPPALDELLRGTELIAGMTKSTIYPDIDFETYSEAGFIWNELTEKFEMLPNAQRKGLPGIGAAVYSEHESTEVLSCAYDLKDGRGKRLWKPGDFPPQDLFEYITNGGIIEAWNCAFERWIWSNVCVKKYGWIPLPFPQLRDAMAKARAHALPGSLDAAGNVLNIKNKKGKEGKRLIDKFSIPRDPTKKDFRKRILLEEDMADAELLYQYNLQDIAAEAEISSLIPDLSNDELEFWLCDQKINFRGVQLDIVSIKNCIKIIERAYEKYNRELFTLTSGQVNAASEIQKIRNWLILQGVECPTLDAKMVTELLKNPRLSPEVRRVLQIREMIGSAAVKKLYAMLNQSTRNGRVHDLFIYHSAKTGRAAGAGAQPQNLPNSGPLVTKCGKKECSRHFDINRDSCPWCGSYSTKNNIEWNHEAVKDVLQVADSKSLECLEYYFGDAVSVISGSLRGLFISKKDHDLICSDYSSIEAVVLAALAGEKWRLDVFKTHGRIYELSGCKILGVEFNPEIKNAQARKIGKVAELASGYQGWIGAWKQFGADEFLSEHEMKNSILKWRDDSPAITDFWGGQLKNFRTEFYGLEGAAVQAILYPGKEFSYNGINFIFRGDALYCKLLSGRYLTYHRPRLSESDRRINTFSISYEGWNSNPKNGAMGWIRLYTYGGKITENVVQATARDVLAHAIVNLEKAGYPVVLHVHDEIVSEIPECFGSIEEFEKIMMQLPDWAENWPIKAAGGWRDKRYRK